MTTEQGTLDSLDTAGGAIIDLAVKLLLSEPMLFSMLTVYFIVYVISLLPSLGRMPTKRRDLIKVLVSVLFTPPVYVFYSGEIQLKMIMIATVIVTILPYIGLIFLRWKFPKLAELVAPDDKARQEFKKIKASEVPDDRTVFVRDTGSE